MGIMTPAFEHGPVTVYRGDCREVMAGLPDNSVDAIVTSPPYFFMRDYGEDQQIGLEKTPEEYIEELRAVMREARRLLKPSGTCWVNLGDAYSQRKAVRVSSHQEGLHGARGKRESWVSARAAGRARMSSENRFGSHSVPEKSLMLLPERLAIGMIEDGWILRNRIVWEKTYALPDQAKDRMPARSEPILFFSKSPRYYFDASAIADLPDAGDVWRLPPSRGKTGHSATFNVALPDRCLAVGGAPGGVVLDPFSGTGTTGVAALCRGMSYIGIDVNQEYIDGSRLALESAAGIELDEDGTHIPLIEKRLGKPHQQTLFGAIA